MDFYQGIINSEVQETLLLIAEIYTEDSQNDKALKLYIDILDARKGVEVSTDIQRKMAPLY